MHGTSFPYRQCIQCSGFSSLTLTTPPSASSFVGLAIEGELAVRLIDVEGPVAEWLVDCFPVIELHHGRLECTGQARAGEVIARNGLHAGVVRPPADAVLRYTLGQLPLASLVTTVEDGTDPWREEAELSALTIDGTTGPASTVRYTSFSFLPQPAP